MQMEVNIIHAQRYFEEGWAQTLCGIIANCMPFTTISDVKPWECTYPIPSESSVYTDLPNSPEVYGERPQFYRAKKLKSPPPPFQEDDEISEYDSPPPATLHTARKRARPLSDIVCETPAKKTPYVIDLRSPERMPRPSATAEQIANWSHPASPSAYLSPSRIPTTSAFFPPATIPVTSSSASCSQPPDSSHQTATLNSFCTVPVGTIAAMSQAPKRLMWDSGANRSGTGSTAGLRNVTVCPPLSIQGAFGPPIQPTYRGELGPMNLETVVIDGMGPSTIVSVSQVCKLGHIAVFTNTEFRVYKAESILNALKVLALEGKPVAYGKMENGLYYQESN